MEKDNIKELIERAEAGDAAAQNELGYMYYYGDGVYGDGVEEDNAKAFEWFTKSAEQGYAASQYMLGQMYYYGYGVESNYKTAREWYEKAAKQNNAAAQFRLGYMYRYGYGVVRNYIKAINYFTKAADQNNADAQNELGNMYNYGYGVTMNEEESVAWYEKAAKQGHTDAQYKLGDIYYYGYGHVGIDFEKALSWYEKAAGYGSIGARNKTGDMYYYGQGISQDYKKAEEWYKKSSENWNLYAMDMLDRLQAKKNHKTTYVIEGTISELRKEVSTKKDSTEKNCNIKIKISGSEGYSVKRDKEIYNVFCPEDMPKEDGIKSCYIMDSKSELLINDEEYENVLTQVSSYGKRVRLTLEVDDTKTLEEYVNAKQPLPLKSVTLLQN